LIKKLSNILLENSFNIIGKPVIRQDALEKVTGKAKFADDINESGQLYGVMVRLPTVHATIEEIDYSEILQASPQVIIVDSTNIKGLKKVGPIKQDQPIFAFDKIVTPGDVIAMLVGESEEQLKNLTKKIKVKFTELPVLTDSAKALDSDAPRIHPQYENNLIVHYPLRKGDIEKGFKESDFFHEETYTTQLIEHAYIEPEAVLAIPLEGNKGIKIIGSIQNPFTARKVVASVLNWPLTKVRIVQAELGGSFGGKDDTMNILSARAAIAALKVGKPVKIHYSREESILESYKRHPYKMKYKVGCKENGKIIAMKIEIIADGGAYASQSPFVTWRSVIQATGPYEIENVWTDVKAVYTNNPYTGAMRGFGSPQVIFAQESIMDEIAIKLGLTPDEIRKINGFKAGSYTASGQKLENHDVNLLTVLDVAVKETDFASKWKEYGRNKSDNYQLDKISEENKEQLILKQKDFINPSNVMRKGIGLSISYRGCSLGAEGIDAVAAYLSVQSDGSAYLLSGLAENGQGLRTTFSIIAAEVLGISTDKIYYLETDTGLIPDSGPTVASRSTLMGGRAVKSAAEIIRKRLEDILIIEWKLKENTEFVFRDGFIFSIYNSDQKIVFNDLCQLAYENGISLSAMGLYKGPNVNWDEHTGQGSAYFTYVYGCQVAEVTVNMASGQVYIDKITAVHDPGKVINLLGAEGQVYGGVTQGAGYGIWEQVTTDNSNIRELNFDQYLIPTSKDLKEITPIFIEGRDTFGAWGAKSLGEPTLELTSAAIANAIRNATGKRFYNLPINLEEVLLRKKLFPKDLKRGSA
jgi:CO/xanthine dehydrogenase Mo-binding subunit